MNTINERLAALVEHTGLGIPAVAKKADGMDPNTLRKAMKGPSKPSIDTTAAILQAFPKYSPDWLLWGKEPMLRADIKAEPMTPFFPGAKTNAFGATVLMPGELEHRLPKEDLFKDIQGNTEVEQTKQRKEFVAGLMQEIEKQKGEIADLKALLLRSQTDTDRAYSLLDKCQQQVSTLLGKYSGNHVAPVSLREEPRPIVAGLIRYDQPFAMLPKRRSIWPRRRRNRLARVLAMYTHQTEVSSARKAA